ncbi:hypothetical protein [Spirillospora sp. CA-128828]
MTATSAPSSTGRNTITMIAAAAVITRAVRDRPSATSSAKSIEAAFGPPT